MFTTSRTVLSATALLLSAVAAGAADYDPPIVVDNVDYAPEVPVEVGSGWYLRGDVSYNFNRPVLDGAIGAPVTARFTEDSLPISATVGFGYHFTDYFRMEANIGLLNSQTSELVYVDPGVVSAQANTDNKMWSGMISAYGDLGTFVGFTPYVGAGVGLVQSTRRYDAQIDFAGATPDIDYTDVNRGYSVAYSLGGGVAYQVAPNWALDLGYQYLRAPKAEYAEITGVNTYAIRQGLDLHQIKLGVRYDLW
ncbi:MAG: porin family protein [Rhizobiaceae bacterium]|nr:porin family protein [Rhizobiaceae bacterium]